VLRGVQDLRVPVHGPDQRDNENNGCASEMFFEIIVRRRLTSGLFSWLCHDDDAPGFSAD
jgi:hypothetical protein